MLLLPLNSYYVIVWILLRYLTNLLAEKLHFDSSFLTNTLKMDNATFWSLFLVNSVRLLYCYCALPQEPICSKFDFEERILEKMVRMEHSNGVMMEEFRKLAVDVKENLRVMQSEFDMIKQEASEERERNKQMIEGKYFQYSK